MQYHCIPYLPGLYIDKTKENTEQKRIGKLIQIAVE